MSTEEHLNRIVARCRDLLAIAEKRTQGVWSESRPDLNGLHKVEAKTVYVASELFKEDAVFVANCAGPAEAGWRATIDEIEELAAFELNVRKWKDDNGCAGAAIQFVHSRRARIIAAWPEELLS